MLENPNELIPYDEVTEDTEIKAGTMGSQTEAAANSYSGYAEPTVTQEAAGPNGETVVVIMSTYIRFDANGGEGLMADQELIYGGDHEKITSNAFTKADADFVNWNTEADGTGTSFDADEIIFCGEEKIQENYVFLYAQWKERSTEDPAGPEKPTDPEKPDKIPNFW